MTREERKLALYCLKASSDYHSEVCEECIKYPNCDHVGQDDVTETIIKALEQEPRKGHWIEVTNGRGGHECNICHRYAPSYRSGDEYLTKYCPDCGAKMIEPQESEDEDA